MRSLLLLVANALLLPDLEPTTADPLDDPEGLDSECQDVAAAAATLGVDLYWEVFDPRELSEPVAGSLSDDLADIYRDLRRGLAAAERDIEEAVWDWRFSYETHWGNRECPLEWWDLRAGSPHPPYDRAASRSSTAV